MAGIRQTIIGSAELALPEPISLATIGNPPVDGQGYTTVLGGGVATTQVLGTIPSAARAPGHVSIRNTGTAGSWFISFGHDPTDVISAATAGIQLDTGDAIVIDNPRKGTILAIEPTGAAGAELRSEGAWAI